MLKGAAVSFDQIYLNIPPQQLLTIAVVLFAVVTGFVTLVLGVFLTAKAMSVWG